jgi:hypothetical protein
MITQKASKSAKKEQYQTTNQTNLKEDFEITSTVIEADITPLNLYPSVHNTLPSQPLLSASGL